MAPLQRSSTMNTTTRASASLMKALAVPYTRRRVTPEQLNALNKMFDLRSHPSREDRATLASEMDMELKTVTNWFQNKRQTSKKRSAVWKDDSISNNHRLQLGRSASAPSLSTRRLHPTISLDQIAGLHEKPAGPTVSTAVPRPPLTPRNTNQRSHSFTDRDDLWEHMPSSPVVPPSSPSAESVRFSVLPSRSKARKSLEWACAKARAEKCGEDEELSSVAGVDRREGSCEEMDTDDETDSDVEEAVTPGGSANFSPSSNSSYKHMLRIVVPRGKENINPNFSGYHPSEDVEAAMVLLGFMGR